MVKARPPVIEQGTPATDRDQDYNNYQDNNNRTSRGGKAPTR